MGFMEDVKRDIRTQKKLLAIYRKELEQLPKGKLHCKMIKGVLRYYRWDEQHKEQIYIRKKDETLVGDLKHRRMLEEAVASMENNVRAQEKLLKEYKPYDPHSCQNRLGKVYQDIPEKDYGKKANPNAFFTYKGSRSNYRRDELIHKSAMGIMFRSKSEALIAELLYRYKIPFEYESELFLIDESGKQRKLLPDFKITLPNGRVVYWEHFGRMDLPDYRAKNFERLAVYHYNHIFPPNNLIITMESRQGAIDVNAIIQIIETQLLPYFQNKMK